MTKERINNSNNSKPHENPSLLKSAYSLVSSPLR